MDSKILLTGATSRICREFKDLLSGKQHQYQIVELGRSPESSYHVDLSRLDEIDSLSAIIGECDKIVLAHGVLSTLQFAERTEEDILYSIKTNLLSFVRITEIALAANPRARIVVVGSESGVKGSYDIAYALAKSALHKYVAERKIKSPEQQLVCIAPSLIADAGMTTRRYDQENVQRSIQANPKVRGLTSKEVAEMIHFLLFVDQGYTTNAIIQMDGGKFARM